MWFSCLQKVLVIYELDVDVSHEVWQLPQTLGRVIGYRIYTSEDVTSTVRTQLNSVTAWSPGIWRCSLPKRFCFSF